MNRDSRISSNLLKRILLISYHFPPDNAVGGLRIARFSRYLPSFGWEPIVLTIKDSHRDRLDRSRMKDVKDVMILQTAVLPGIKDVYLWSKRIVSFVLRKKDHKRKEEIKSIVHSAPTENKKETVIQKVKRYFISLFIFLPDQSKNWVMPAVLRAFYEIKNRKIDCMLTSGPPDSSHLVGLLAKKMTGTMWIADFRDPWTDDFLNRSPLSRSALSDRIEKWMEKQVIRNADAVLTTTKQLKRLLQDKYQIESRDKFLYIPNGVDTVNIQCERQPKNYAKYTITYAGTLYQGRNPVPVFEAIRNLIVNGRIGSDEISLKLIGNCDLIEGRPTVEVIRDYGLDNIVEVSGFVPYNEAIQVMRRSHLLLLVVPSNHYLCIPAKIYDYFGTGTRILAVTEDGATRELINETKSGECFSPIDIYGISEHIYRLMRNKDQQSSKIDPSSYSQFDAKHLTKLLTDKLSTMTARSQCSTIAEKEEPNV